MDIAVIGCGASGLTTGFLLAQKGYQVTVYTEKTHPNVTSSAACAIFLPLWTSDADKVGPDYDKLMTQWSLDSWAEFKERIGGKYGIRWVTNHELYLQPEEIPDYLYFIKDIMPDFVATQDEQLPYQPEFDAKDGSPRKKFAFRWSFKTLVIETPIYLPQLMQDFLDMGGRIVENTKFNRMQDIHSLEEDVVFNCTGMGSRELFLDKSLSGVKGQLLLHEPVDLDFAVGADQFCLIPRSDGLILGSLTQKEYDTEMPTKENDDLLWKTLNELCNEPGKITSLLPGTISKEKLMRSIAGIRPYRANGIRVELEKNGMKYIVHNYGHGGGGITLSWGCAKHAVRLLEKLPQNFKRIKNTGMVNLELSKFEKLLDFDTDYFQINKYNADPKTPVHGWYLIKESSDLNQIASLMDELQAKEYDLVVDPFCGSGTVGLQCEMIGANFLGFDKLACCVIGTKAKLALSNVEFNDFKVAQELTLDYLDNPTNFSKEETLSVYSVEKFFLELQNFLIGKVSIPELYLILASFYSTLTPYNPTVYSTFSEIRQELRARLQIVEKDLRSLSILREPSEHRMWWADSARSTWKEIMTRRDVPHPKKMLLLTSPTHIDSSQNRTEMFTMSNRLAKACLNRLGDKRLQENDHRDLHLGDDVNDIFEKVPKKSKRYFQQIAQVLIQFSSVSKSGSRAVIECDNAKTGNRITDADLIICGIAEKLGFAPHRIRVTHYVERPGKITSNPTLLRGSLIYLDKR